MTLRIAVACLFAAVACDTTPGREAATVQRDYATWRQDVADVVDPDTQVAPDTSAPDTLEPPDTFVPDTTAPETVADTTPDTTAPETIADTTPETTPETVADTTPETVPDTTPDTTPETVADTAGEVDVGPVGGPCQVGSLVGQCRHIEDCADGVAAEGFCEGGPRVRCCFDSDEAWERCSAARAPGVCMSTALCTGPAWKTSTNLCPGPADIRCCSSTATPPTCDPAVRPTPNAGLVEAPGDPGCPPGMVRLSGTAGDYCMDQFEASLVRADDPSVSLSPYHNPGSTPARAVSMRWAVPQGYIDEVRAKSACDNAGKRLCTTDEWLAACRGDASWDYPYGPEREPGRCNDDRRQHVAVEFFGTVESWIFSEIDNACLTQLAASLDLAGENEGCQTPTGLYDLMGNLHEWVDDAAGTFRGGFFDDTVLNGDGCLYRTTAHDVSHWDYSTGFRCCADLQP